MSARHLPGDAPLRVAGAAREAVELARRRRTASFAVLDLVRRVPGISEDAAVQELATAINSSAQDPAKLVRGTIRRYLETGRLQREGDGLIAGRPPGPADPAWSGSAMGDTDDMILRAVRLNPGVAGASIRASLASQVRTTSRNPGSVFGARIRSLVGRGLLWRDPNDGYHTVEARHLPPRSPGLDVGGPP
jgi:hypothetical protein